MEIHSIGASFKENRALFILVIVTSPEIGKVIGKKKKNCNDQPKRRIYPIFILK